eukprot:gene41492-56130_t
METILSPFVESLLVDVNRWNRVQTRCVLEVDQVMNIIFPVQQASKKTKKMHMYERILHHQYNGDSSDLAAFITGPVPFKIVVTDLEYVEKYPEVFEHGTAEYRYAVDTFMAHHLIGETEVIAVVQDSNWICILERMLTSVHDGVAM